MLEHADVLQHFPSIGHAICDLKKDKVNSKAFQLLGEKEETYDNLLKTLFGLISSTFNNVLKKVQTLTWETIISISTADPYVPTFIDELQDILTKIVESGGKVANYLMCSFFELAAKLWDYLKSFFNDTEAVRETLECQSIFDTYGSAIYGFMKYIAGSLLNIVNRVYDLVISAGKQVLNMFISGMDAVIQTVKDTSSLIYRKAIGIITWLYSAGQELIEMAVAAKDRILDYLEQVAKSFVLRLVGVLPYIDFTGFKDNVIVKTLGLTIKTLSQVFNWLGNMILGIVSFATKLLPEVQQALQNPILFIVKKTFGFFKKEDTSITDLMDLQIVLEELHTNEQVVGENKQSVEEAKQIVDGLQEKLKAITGQKPYTLKDIMWRIDINSRVLSSTLMKDLEMESAEELLQSIYGMNMEEFSTFYYMNIDFAKWTVNTVTQDIYEKNSKENVSGRVTFQRKMAKIEEFIPQVKIYIRDNNTKKLKYAKSTLGFTDKSIDSLEKLLDAMYYELENDIEGRDRLATDEKLKYKTYWRYVYQIITLGFVGAGMWKFISKTRQYARRQKFALYLFPFSKKTDDELRLIDMLQWSPRGILPYGLLTKENIDDFKQKISQEAPDFYERYVEGKLKLFDPAYNIYGQVANPYAVESLPKSMTTVLYESFKDLIGIDKIFKDFDGESVFSWLDTKVVKISRTLATIAFAAAYWVLWATFIFNLISWFIDVIILYQTEDRDVAWEETKKISKRQYAIFASVLSVALPIILESLNFLDELNFSKYQLFTSFTATAVGTSVTMLTGNVAAGNTVKGTISTFGNSAIDSVRRRNRTTIDAALRLGKVIQTGEPLPPVNDTFNKPILQETIPDKKRTSELKQRTPTGKAQLEEKKKMRKKRPVMQSFKKRSEELKKERQEILKRFEKLKNQVI